MLLFVSFVNSRLKVAILKMKIISEKINFFKIVLIFFFNFFLFYVSSCDFPGIQCVLTAFFTRVSFVKVKTANFRLFCFKTDQVLFFTISNSGDEEIATKQKLTRNGRRKCETKRIARHFNSYQFCLVHEISGAKIKPVSKRRRAL